jgi:hypothetical protein
MKLSFRAGAALCALAFAALPLAAEGTSESLGFELMGAYYIANQEGYGVDAGGFAPINYSVLGGASGQRDLGSTWGGAEAKAVIDKSWTIPALVSEGALTEGNNLALDLSGEISPVSLNAGFKATLTPIAFLKFQAGAKVGTGWSIGFDGLGLNEAGTTVARPFGGVVCQAWASGTFQFDLAALMPGDWNHVVVLASPQIAYQYCSLAGDDDAWVWEADSGMDYNGLKLKGSYVLAYQMPLALNMVGILAEPEGYIGSVAAKSTAASGGWGSDATTWGLSAIFNFKLSDKASLALLPQIKSHVKWTDATTRDADFRDRVFEGYYWYLNRIAFDFSLEL